MFFNSLEFAIFLPVVFILYWFVFNKNLTYQNILLLVASYFFYAYWDYRFLALLFFSTCLDFFSGLQIESAKSQRMRTFWMWLSVLVNLSFLGVFKYYNFFAASFADLLGEFGVKTDLWTLKIILPVGISFYTFHGLSYILDIYKQRITPTKNFVDYAVFVSFFPLLVAGPIERATHLLPQIEKPRNFSLAVAKDGLRQILWGLFKKIVIADTCAEYANAAFNNPLDHSGSTHLVGAVFFAFQIYCDFSGYSDIALGCARLFGIELLRNFAFPYFSRDIAEFWRRWHISLSKWFRDYLYFPLGGSKGGTWMKIRNTFIIFLVSGFWHGANWTFIVWGALNAFYFLPLMILDRNRDNLDIVAVGRTLPTLKDFLNIAVTFLLTVFAWIFFRANSIHHAFQYIGEMFSKSMFSVPEQLSTVRWEILCVLIAFLMTIEWFGRENRYGIETTFLKKPAVLRWGFYYLIITMMFIFSGKEQQFIYFQF